MHRWLAAMIAATVLTGCEFVSDPADARMRADLVGSWRFEYKDDFDRPVQGTVRLAEDGKFFGMEMVKEEEGLEEAKLSGLWYVTAGLFKLNTQVTDGQSLGIFQQGFFTCEIIDFSSKGFGCRDRLANKTYTYRRASNAS